MTENRRILLNVVATYGRSLYGLAIGIFCGRWSLMVLGEIDYGLLGLVGGMLSFITFFNGILSGAVSRFFAFSIGAAKKSDDPRSALEECRRWFNTALCIHSVIPFVLLLIGYPIGEYAVRHWLTIPPDRIGDCVWVFRCVCLSWVVSAVTIPYSALYGAKQYIAELTVYSFITATLNVLALYYMLHHPGTWLVPIAVWGCVLGVVPTLIIALRARHLFPECRIVVAYMWDKDRLKKVFSYSGWQILGTVAAILRTNGVSIVVNKFFGAAMNAAQTVGNTLNGQCNSLAASMQSAFVPVITQACGAGDYDKVNRFAVRAGKFNVLLFFIFAIPLALEIDEVMVLWLKKPPAFAAGLCLCAMLWHVINSCTTGHMVAVNASGRVAAYQITLSGINVFTLPFVVLTGFLTRNIYIMMLVVSVFEGINSIARVLFARKLVGTSIRSWVSAITRCLLAGTLVIGFGSLPKLFFAASFYRVVLTTVISELIFLPLTWFILLDADERQFVASRLQPKFAKLRLLFKR